VNRIGAILVAGVLVCLLAPARAGAVDKLRGNLISNGGTPVGGLTGTGKVLNGAAGQAAVGRSAGSNKDLCHGFWCFGGVQIVGVEDGPGGTHAPTVLEFGLPTPNPMRERMGIALSLPKAGEVRVDVFDVQGRVVGAMHAGQLDPGVYRLEWDGTDGEGHASGAGVYFARLQVDGRVITQRRFVRLR